MCVDHEGKNVRGVTELRDFQQLNGRGTGQYEGLVRGPAAISFLDGLSAVVWLVQYFQQDVSVTSREGDRQ